MKKILAFILLLCCGLTACQSDNNEHHNDSHHSTLETQEKYLLNQFFEAFEKQDYEIMKTYCTQECIDNLFHEGNVWGIKSAKLKRVDTTQCLSHHEYSVFVDIEMETTKESALYPETSTSLYIVFVKDHNHNLKIHSFETG